MDIAILFQALCFHSLIFVLLLPRQTASFTVDSHLTNNTNLTKRKAFTPGGPKPQGYDNLVAKGDQLIQMMQGSIAEANSIYKKQTQSQWTTLKDASQYGWQLSWPNSEDFPDTATADMQMMAKQLSLPSTYPPNVDIVFDHSQSWKYPNGKTSQGQTDTATHKPTGAQYRVTINPRNGLIVASSSYSPKYKVSQSQITNKQLTPADIPPLNHWSDLAFQALQAAPSKVGMGTLSKVPPLQKLTYVTRARITTAQTLNVLRYLVGGNDAKLHSIGNWDQRVECQISDDDCKALLASPQGSSAAWLLIGYKTQFGVKSIVKISVWNGESETGSGQYNPHVVFWVENVSGKSP